MIDGGGLIYHAGELPDPLVSRIRFGIDGS
jgi:hypothetical protein